MDGAFRTAAKPMRKSVTAMITSHSEFRRSPDTEFLATHSHTSSGSHEEMLAAILTELLTLEL